MNYATIRAYNRRAARLDHVRHFVGSLCLCICACLVPDAKAQSTLKTFTLTDYWGIAKPLQPVELCDAAIPVMKYPTHRVLVNGSEVGWQMLTKTRDGKRCIVTEPLRRPASSIRFEFNYEATGVLTGTEYVRFKTAPAGGTELSIITVGDKGIFSNPPAGLSGVVHIVTDDFWGDSKGQFSSTSGGMPNDITGTASGYFMLTAFERSTNNIVCGTRNCDSFQNGDRVRFTATGALPDGLVAGTYYFLKNESADTFSVWEDAALTSQVTLSDAGSGAFEIISELVIELQSGAPTTVQPTNPVRVATTTNYFEVTNGLLGIRLLTEAGQTNPAGRYHIRGLQLRDGTWIATEDNLLYRELFGSSGGWGRDPVGATGAGNWGTEDPVLSYRVVILDRGPVLFRYRCEFLWGTQDDFVQDGIGTLTNRGIGFAYFEQEVYANTQMVIPYWKTNMPLAAQLNLTAAAAFDKVRRIQTGQDRKDHSIIDFTEGTGEWRVAYGIGNEGTSGDSGMNCASPGNVGYPGSCVDTLTWRKSRWALTYEDAGAGGSPVIGFLAGWTDQQYMTGSLSYYGTLVHVDGSPIFGDGTENKIIFFTGNPINTGSSLLPLYESKYGLVISTKADAGIAAALDADTLVDGYYANHAGPVGLTNEARWDIGGIDNPTPACDWATEKPCGWKSPYMTNAAWAAIVNEIVTNSGYADSLIATLALENGEHGATIVKGLRNNNAAGVAYVLRAARVAAAAYLGERAREGNMGPSGYYKMPTEGYMRQAPAVVAALLDANTTEEQRDIAVQILGAFVSVAADRRYSCIQNASPNTSCGDSAGVGNQPLQLFQALHIGAAMLGHHAPMASVAVRGATEGKSTIVSIFGNCSIQNAPSYMGALAAPGKTWMRALVHLGYLSESDFESMVACAQQWFMDIMSSPDGRVSGGRRQLIGSDSVTEKGGHIGDIPIADAPSCYFWLNELSATRAGAEFFQNTLVTHDDLCSGSDPAATMISRQYTSHSQIIRHNYNTANEVWGAGQVATSVDHMHTSEQGCIQALAALGSMLVSTPVSKGNPNVTDRLMKNCVSLESSLTGGRTWDGDSQPIGGNTGESQCADANVLCTRWGALLSTEFTAFTNSTFARSVFDSSEDWTRDIVLAADDAARPIIIARHSFTSTGNKISTMNILGSGAITTPEGSYTPTSRVHTGGSDADRPSNSDTAPTAHNISLTSDAVNAFTYTVTGPADMKLYLVPVGGSGALWNSGHFQYPAQGGDEGATNIYINRVRHTGTVWWILRPYLDGAGPTDTPGFNTVDCPDGLELEYTVSMVDYRHCIAPSFREYTNGSVDTLATFDANSHAYASMTIEGGPASMTANGGGIVTVELDGRTAANRTITFPAGTWYCDDFYERVDANTITVFHGGTGYARRDLSCSATPSGGTITTQWAAPSGAEFLQIEVDGVGVLRKACSTTCTTALTAPSGEYTGVVHKWLDGSGNTLLTSATRSLTFP